MEQRLLDVAVLLRGRVGMHEKIAEGLEEQYPRHAVEERFRHQEVLVQPSRMSVDGVRVADVLAMPPEEHQDVRRDVQRPSLDEPCPHVEVEPLTEADVVSAELL